MSLWLNNVSYHMPYMSFFWENIASSRGNINYLIYFIFF